MTIPVTWQTDELCPSCGTAVTATDEGGAQITLDCGHCGWSATATDDPGSEVAR